MLHLKSISFSFPDGTSALNRISFHLKTGAILGIAGSSGSGKSTLLNAIYGLIDVSSGLVMFNNEKVTGPASNLVPGHPKMRLAGQFHSLQSNLPVIEQIKYKLLSYKPEFREKKALELLEMVGLTQKKQHLPKQLSGGQQQMVNLCCALAEEPELLLLDEPFNNLDQRAKKNLKDYLIFLRKIHQLSIVIVSHDPTDLLSVSDEILVLQNGKKIQIDNPEKVFYTPKNEYVAGLFGEYNKLKLKGKNKFIRPSQIELFSQKTKGTLTGKVLAREFHGNLYSYQIENEKYGKIYVLSHATFKAGERLFLKFS